MKLAKSWKRRLIDAEKYGNFTVDDLYKVSSFDTCFIGEHHDKPTLSLSELTNEEVRLGEAAFKAVHANDIKKAKRIYRQVQKLYEAKQEN